MTKNTDKKPYKITAKAAKALNKVLREKNTALRTTQAQIIKNTFAIDQYNQLHYFNLNLAIQIWDLKYPDYRPGLYTSCNARLTEKNQAIIPFEPYSIFTGYIGGSTSDPLHTDYFLNFDISDTYKSVHKTMSKIFPACDHIWGDIDTFKPCKKYPEYVTYEQSQVTVNPLYASAVFQLLTGADKSTVYCAKHPELHAMIYASQHGSAIIMGILV